MGGLVAHVILVSIGLLVLGLGLRLGLRGLDLGLELDNFQVLMMMFPARKDRVMLLI